MLETVSKSEFARLCGRSPQRVGQWIAEGKIGPDEMDGDRIKVEAARAAVMLKSNLGHSLGNNWDKKLEETAADRRLKELKVEDAERRNRQAHSSELLERGQLMLAADAKAAMGKQAVTILGYFEGGLTEIANNGAARFNIPKRDLLHWLKEEFVALRQRTADGLRLEAKTEPELIESDL